MAQALALSLHADGMGAAGTPSATPSAAPGGYSFGAAGTPGPMRSPGMAAAPGPQYAHQQGMHWPEPEPASGSQGGSFVPTPPRTDDGDSGGDLVAQLCETVCATDAPACSVIMGDRTELGRFLGDCDGRIDGTDGAAERLRRAIIWRRRCDEMCAAHPAAQHPACQSLPIDPPEEKPKRDSRERAVLVRLGELRQHEPEDIVFAFFLCWQHVLRRARREKGLSVAVCLSGLREGLPLTAIPVMQRVSACLSLHYPLRVERVVLFPCPPAAEKLVKEVTEVMDVGRVMGHAELRLLPSYAEAAALLQVPEEHLAAPGAAHRAHRRIAGDAAPPGPLLPPLVHTPWCPKGVPPGSISLEEELRLFAAFVMPTEHEKARRNAMRSTLQQKCESVARGVTVKLVGSGAVGLLTPSCPLQFAADCNEPEDAHALLTAAGMRVDPSSECGTAIGGRAVDCVHATSPCGANVEVLTGAKGADARRAVAVWRELLAQQPAVADAFCVLRCILAQAGSGAGPKGVGPNALLAMLCHVAHRSPLPHARSRRRNRRPGARSADVPPPLAPAQPRVRELLSAFFTYYGSFDFEHLTIDPGQSEALPRVPEHQGCMVSVLGPVGRWNFAASCKYPELLRQQLKYCGQALAKAECKSGTAQKRPTLRTPLSQLVSHNPLWPRCRDRIAAVPLSKDPESVFRVVTSPPRPPPAPTETPAAAAAAATAAGPAAAGAAAADAAGAPAADPQQSGCPRAAGPEPAKMMVYAGKSYLWCACGHSKCQPLCDGSHHAVNAAQGSNFIPYVWIPRESGTVSFCMCKHSRSAPFCDGTHRTLGADIEELPLLVTS
eukprot:TRINITY_DN10469_c0_g1_i1.p1 TRINITY_DN10469_c0_g1~~TRINITY_DN10469_c0_g1_i1.p1  ORF type:complete len:859 (+),score=217.63 TRINITY_DN10469_c0_g1_i1:78-2579(+)